MAKQILDRKVKVTENKNAQIVFCAYLRENGKKHGKWLPIL